MYSFVLVINNINREKYTIIVLVITLLILAFFSSVHTKNNYVDSESLLVIKVVLLGLAGLLIFIIPSFFRCGWSKVNIAMRAILATIVFLFFFFTTPNIPPDPTIKLNFTNASPIIDFRTFLARAKDIKNIDQLQSDIEQRYNAYGVISLNIQYVMSADRSRSATVKNEKLYLKLNNETLEFYGAYLVEINNNYHWIKIEGDLSARRLRSGSLLENEILFIPFNRDLSWRDLKAKLDDYSGDTLLATVKSRVNGRQTILECYVDMNDYRRKVKEDETHPLSSMTFQPRCIKQKES